MPELEIAIPRPQRWDEPFGELTDADVDALLRIEPFRSIDASAFPATLPLRGILLGDTRIVRYGTGDFVVREGDYGNSAFLVLDGAVRVVLERLNPELLGRDLPPRRGWKQAIAQLWQNSRLPEVRNLGVANGHGANGNLQTRRETDSTRVFCRTCRAYWRLPELYDSHGENCLASWPRSRARRAQPRCWPTGSRRFWRFVGKGCAT